MPLLHGHYNFGNLICGYCRFFVACKYKKDQIINFNYYILLLI